MQQKDYLIPVLHRCRYNHRWIAYVTPNFIYTHPSQRFCLECLEAYRIEIGLIRLTVPDPIHLGSECTHCATIMNIALVPDGTAIDSLTSSRPRWFFLPVLWPTCIQCGKKWLEVAS